MHLRLLHVHTQLIGPIQNMTQGFVLRCVAFTLMLLATQSNPRIDSDSILAFLHLVMNNCKNLNIFTFHKLDATQCKGLASYCEPSCTFLNFMQVSS